MLRYVDKCFTALVYLGLVPIEEFVAVMAVVALVFLVLLIALVAVVAVACFKTNLLA